MNRERRAVIDELEACEKGLGDAIPGNGAAIENRTIET